MSNFRLVLLPCFDKLEPIQLLFVAICNSRFHKLSYLRAETSVTGTCGLLLRLAVTVGVTVYILYSTYLCAKNSYWLCHTCPAAWFRGYCHPTDFCELSYLHCLQYSPQLVHLTALRHCNRQFIRRSADVL